MPNSSIDQSSADSSNIKSSNPMSSHAKCSNSMSTIASEFETIALSKNPISILFGIARIRELFLDFADDLLSGIEKSYYEDSASKYIDLIELYQKHGFYKIIAASEWGTKEFAIQKKYLDAYFEESYWRDVDFYFFVLDKHPELHAKLEIFRIFSLDPESLDRYLSATDPESRIQMLVKISERNGLNTQDFIRTPACTDFFDTLLPELNQYLKGSFINRVLPKNVSNRRIIRDIYLFMIADRAGEKVDFWKKYFIENAPVNRYLVEQFTDSTIMECFGFLRSKLLRTPKYNLALSDKSIYRTFIDRAYQKKEQSLEWKLEFLADVNETMGKDSIRREQFQNVLRKGLAYSGAIDLVDAVLGVTFLKRVAFYEVKRRVITENFEKFAFDSLQNVKVLIDMLESSAILRFFRPFFMLRLSQVFNKRSDLYYFIKFILTIHGTSSYNEYQQISRFFLSLEAFGRNDLRGWFLKMSQFGWLLIVLGILVFFAPFGVLAGFLAYGIFRGIQRLVKNRDPELILLGNFQLGSFIALFIVISLTFGLTFGLKDNMAIIYRNYQTAINSMTLVSSEVLGRVEPSGWFKASVGESGMTSSKSSGTDLQRESQTNGSVDSDAQTPRQTHNINPISQVDYLNGKDYRELMGK